jgi:hypothetical protein
MPRSHPQREACSSPSIIARPANVNSPPAREDGRPDGPFVVTASLRQEAKSTNQLWDLKRGDGILIRLRVWSGIRTVGDG